MTNDPAGRSRDRVGFRNRQPKGDAIPPGAARPAVMNRSPAMKREPMPKNSLTPTVWNGRRNRKARIPSIRGLRFKLFSIKIHRGNSATMMSTANEFRTGPVSP